MHIANILANTQRTLFSFEILPRSKAAHSKICIKVLSHLWSSTPLHQCDLSSGRGGIQRQG